MRAIATNAALRALRAARTYKIPTSASSVSFRGFCVNTPPVLTGTKSEPETEHISSTDPLPNLSVSDAGVESPDTVSKIDDSSSDSATETLATGNVEISTIDLSDEESKLDINEEGTADIEAPASSSKSFDGNSQNRVDLNQFSSPDELASYLESIVDQSQMRAMLLFRTALEQEGAPLVSESSINVILPVMARNGWYQTTKDIIKFAGEKGIVLTTLMYNCALFAMTRTGDLEAMQSVIQKMSELGNSCRPNATSYNLLIASYFYRGKIEDAFGVLQEMKLLAIYPTIATYQTLVSGCLRRRDYHRAYETLLAIEKQGMNVNAMTVAQVLHCAAQNDQCDHIPILMSKLERNMPVYIRDIDRIAIRRSTFSKGNESSLKENVRGTPRLELSCFDSIMHAAARGGRPDIAVQAWNMRENMYPELEMTNDHWYSLIGALSAAGKLESAFDAIGHMKAAGFEPSIRSLSNILIRPLSMDVERIDEIYYYLVERIEGKDLIPEEDDGNNEQLSEYSTEDSSSEELTMDNVGSVVSDETATDDGSSDVESALEADTVQDLVSDADEALEAPPSSEITEHVSLSEAIGVGSECQSDPAMITFPWASKRRAEITITELNCVIGACAMAGDLDRAFQTYDEACGRLGFTRNADTLNALLEGCVQARHIRGGMRILEEARADGTEMNMDTLHLACRLYCRVNRGGDALALLREAVDTDVPVAARTWVMLARHLARSGSFDESAECVQLAVKQGYRENGIKPAPSVLRERDERSATREADIDMEQVTATEDDVETDSLLESEHSTQIKADS